MSQYSVASRQGKANFGDAGARSLQSCWYPRVGSRRSLCGRQCRAADWWSRLAGPAALAPVIVSHHLPLSAPIVRCCLTSSESHFKASPLSSPALFDLDVLSSLFRVAIMC